MKILSDLYEEYRKITKNLLFLIEAKSVKLPTPILNEIRAYNDHIARYFSSEFDASGRSKQLDKAKGHIERLSWDCYKYFVCYLSDENYIFRKRFRILDFTTIDKGEFYVNYKKLEQDAIELFEKAKNAECKTDITFEDKVAIYEDALEAYILHNNFIQDKETRKKLRVGKIKAWAKLISKGVLWVVVTALLAFISDLFSKM